MVVLAPVERAPEDLLDQDSEDTFVNADDFEERVVRVDARELPTVGTLTFMRFGVPLSPKLSCLGVTLQGSCQGAGLSRRAREGDEGRPTHGRPKTAGRSERGGRKCWKPIVCMQGIQHCAAVAAARSGLGSL